MLLNHVRLDDIPSTYKRLHTFSETQFQQFVSEILPRVYPFVNRGGVVFHGTHLPFYF